MAETFVKLFGSITDSTIWMEDSDTRIVWVTMLAMADHTGYVGASVPGLAARARVDVEKTRAALTKFLSPDPDSRSRDYDGRRIEVADRGWNLLNYDRFRDMRDEEARRQYERERKREQRSRDVPDSPGQSRTVPSSPLLSAQVDRDRDLSPSGSGSSISSSGDQTAGPVPRGVVPPKILLRRWREARAEKFGGLPWSDGPRGIGGGAAFIKPESLREASEMISATEGAEPFIQRSMERFWEDVKSGKHREAKKLARSPAFAFGAWLATFPGDLEEFMGVEQPPDKPRGVPRDGGIAAFLAANKDKVRA